MLTRRAAHEGRIAPGSGWAPVAASTCWTSEPDAWTDDDLATGLSRTYRWGGHSCWELPLSVAQHSLAVLGHSAADGGQGARCPPRRLRELLHDADEGLLGFDCITPLKPHLGRCLQPADRAAAGRPSRALRPARWEQEDYLLHKRADRLAAHQRGAARRRLVRAEIHEEFGTAEILTDDPLLAAISAVEAVGAMAGTTWLRRCSWRTLRELTKR